MRGHPGLDPSRLGAASTVLALAATLAGGATTVVAVHGRGHAASPVPGATRARGVTPSSVGSSAWADFNKDGVGDLAIGLPLAHVGSHVSAGAVVVLYGSTTGLAAARHQEIDQDTAGIDGTAAAGDEFGEALASGDVDGDGYADLIVGIPFEDHTVNGHLAMDEGSVQVIHGGPSGLTTRDVIYFPKPAATVDPGAWHVGQSVVALDAYNGTNPGSDGKADVGIGMPGANLNRGGYAIVSSARLETGTGPAIVSRGGVPKGAELGYRIAAGDFDADGTDDLVLGAPFATVVDPAHPSQTIDYAGLVQIVYGNHSQAKRTLVLGTNGVPAKPGYEAEFGRALAVAHDPTGNAYDSLWVGSPGHVNGAIKSGAVFRFDSKAGGTGIDPAAATLKQGTAAFPDPSEADDHFGESVAVADFGRGGGLDVAVGVTGQDIGAKTSAGAVMVSYSDGTSAVITQDTQGYEGTAATSDTFGSVLFAANFGNGGIADLAVGIPEKTVGIQGGAGQVQVLYGSLASGFTSSNDQTFDLSNSLGLPVGLANMGYALH